MIVWKGIEDKGREARVLFLCLETRGICRATNSGEGKSQWIMTSGMVNAGAVCGTRECGATWIFAFCRAAPIW